LTTSSWRSRWRSYLVVGVLVAATLGATVAALTGASRTRTAFTRLRASTHATDVKVGFKGSLDDPAAAVARVRHIPGITSAAAQALMFFSPDPQTFFPTYTLYTFAPVATPGASISDVPIILRGRAANPARVDEILLNEKMAKAIGARLGSTVTLQGMTDAFVQRLYNGERPDVIDGPKVRVTVVGIARSAGDFSRYKGVIFLTPAFFERYRHEVRVDSGIVARLTPALQKDILAGRPPNLGENVEAETSISADTKSTDDGLGTISVALRLLGLAMALAGAAAVAMAILRLMRVVLRDHAALTAMGCTRRELVEIGLLGAAPWLAVAVGLGLLAGVRASPWTLVGLARSADPVPHDILVDGRVLLIALPVAVVFLAAAVMLATVQVWSERAQSVRRAGRGLAVRRPLPPVLGARYAFGELPERGGRTTQGALVAGVLGTAAVVAALIISASIHRLQVDPTLDGTGTSRGVDSGESTDMYDRALPVLEADRRVSTVVGMHVLFGVQVDGHELNTLAYDLKRGELGASITKGRTAINGNEVMLGPAILELLNKHVGDTVELKTETGHGRFHVVGAVLFPEGDFEHDKGLAMPVRASDRLVGNTHDASSIHQVLYEWKSGVNATRADADLRSQKLNLISNYTGLKPAVVTNLGQVEYLPRLLAIFVGLLAILTLGHAVTTTVRFRRREFGTLRALGTTRPVSAEIVVCQTVATLAVALLGGIPLGIAAGRFTWKPIAERAHLVVAPVVPTGWLAAMAGAAAVAGAVVTIIPAWRAARLRPAQILRAE
jgi:ABC-type lipoprotein release transport system permease subunit